MSLRQGSVIAVTILFVALFLFGTADTFGAEIIGYKYYGTNVGTPNVAGGYFLVDPRATAAYVGNSVYGPTYRWSLTGGSAIDDSLTDSTNPFYVPGSYVEAYGNGGGGFLRYGGNPFINIYTNPGPGVFVGQQLGSYLVRGFAPDIGGAGGLSGGTPGPRFVHLANPDPTTFQAEEIFRNPRSFGFGADLREPKIVGGAIYAEFMPHVNINGYDVPMRLNDVAKLFDVDHFNWRQTIVDPPLPLGWKVEIGFGGQAIRPADQPRIDPIDSSSLQYLVTNGTGKTGHVGYDFVPDDAPFYYNESTVVKAGNVLGFIDAPGYEASFNTNLAYREFKTELVGVTADGEARETGIWFSWKSNVVYGDFTGNVQLIGYDSVSDPSKLPPVIGGEIFDVQVHVPEPSTIAMTTIAALALTAIAWRRRPFLR